MLTRETGAGGGGGEGGRLVLAARDDAAPHPALPSRALRSGMQSAGLVHPLAGSRDYLGSSS